MHAWTQAVARGRCCSLRRPGPHHTHHTLPGPYHGRLRAARNPPCARSKLLAYIWLSELQARLRRAGARVDCFATQPGCASALACRRHFHAPPQLPPHTRSMQALIGRHPVNQSASCARLPLTGPTECSYVASGLMNKVSFRYPLGILAYAGARVIALPPSLGCRSTLVRARASQTRPARNDTPQLEARPGAPGGVYSKKKKRQQPRCCITPRRCTVTSPLSASLRAAARRPVCSC